MIFSITDWLTQTDSEAPDINRVEQPLPPQQSNSESDNADFGLPHYFEESEDTSQLLDTVMDEELTLSSTSEMKSFDSSVMPKREPSPDISREYDAPPADDQPIQRQLSNEALSDDETPSDPYNADADLLKLLDLPPDTSIVGRESQSPKIQKKSSDVPPIQKQTLDAQASDSSPSQPLPPNPVQPVVEHFDDYPDDEDDVNYPTQLEFDEPPIQRQELDAEAWQLDDEPNSFNTELTTPTTPLQPNDQPLQRQPADSPESSARSQQSESNTSNDDNVVNADWYEISYADDWDDLEGNTEIIDWQSQPPLSNDTVQPSRQDSDDDVLDTDIEDVYEVTQPVEDNPDNDGIPESFQPIPLDEALLSNNESQPPVQRQPIERNTKNDSASKQNGRSENNHPQQLLPLDEAILQSLQQSSDIQRAVDVSEMQVRSDVGRTEETEGEESPDEPNVEKIAREVYRRLRSRLRIEQERRSDK